MTVSRSSKKKTITRTFRINEEWNKVLQAEAKRLRVSVNTLMNQILRRYSIFHRFADRYGVLTIPNETFIPILEAASETGLAEAGKISGSTRPKDGLLMMGRPLDFNSLIWMIDELYGGPDFGRWFKCDHHIKINQDIFHLRHNLGKKWSIFTSNYLTYMFKSILDLDVKPELLDQAMTIKIKHKTPRIQA